MHAERAVVSGAGDDQVSPTVIPFVLFHVAVRKSPGSAIIGAPDFEPDEIVGIINDAHLVRFGVTDTQMRFVPNAEYIIGSGACHLNKTFNSFRVHEGLSLRSYQIVNV